MVFTIVGHSIPTFITALLFIFVFAVKLEWFPVSGGMVTPNFKGTGFALFRNKMWHLALPLIIMTVGSLAGLTRYVRAAMIDALSMDYIKQLELKDYKKGSYLFPCLEKCTTSSYNFNYRLAHEHFQRFFGY